MMTALTKSSLALTPSKRERAARLVWTGDGGKGWRVPTVTVDDRPALKALAAELTARGEPMVRPEFVDALFRVASQYLAERSTEQWNMLFEDYWHHLGGISAAHLQDALDAHVRASVFFPKVAELHGPWQAMLYAEQLKLRRARILLGLEDPKPWEKAA